MSGKIVIAGASGIVGGAAVRHFDSLPDWDVVALSRRRPEYAFSGTHLAVDLTDRERCESVLGQLTDATHLVYAALYEKEDVVAGWRDPEHFAVNDRMLRNFLEPLEQAASNLSHVSLMQGAKAYGVHIRPMQVPARERWPRDNHENFYWLQEDFLRARQQAGHGWHFSIFRPHLVTGFAPGSPINMVAAMGALCAIERKRGRPLRFPGGPPFVQQMSDSRLIARAFAWAATAPQARNETYNIANGDVVVWQNLWPTMARHFGIEIGTDEPRSLAESMPSFAGLWDEIVAEHDLKPEPLEKLVGASWQFADFVLGYGKRPGPTILSTIKIRQAGFHDCLDSEDALLEWFDMLQAQRILPH